MQNEDIDSAISTGALSASIHLFDEELFPFLCDKKQKQNLNDPFRAHIEKIPQTSEWHRCIYRKFRKLMLLDPRIRLYLTVTIGKGLAPSIVSASSKENIKKETIKTGNINNTNCKKNKNATTLTRITSSILDYSFEMCAELMHKPDLVGYHETCVSSRGKMWFDAFRRSVPCAFIVKREPYDAFQEKHTINVEGMATPVTVIGDIGSAMYITIDDLRNECSENKSVKKPEDLVVLGTNYAQIRWVMSAVKAGIFDHLILNGHAKNTGNLFEAYSFNRHQESNGRRGRRCRTPVNPCGEKGEVSMWQAPKRRRFETESSIN